MALAGNESIHYAGLQSLGDLQQSPGPLHVSDLANPRRPHKLEPLQSGGGTTKTKRKRTRRKRQAEVEEQRGDLDGREEASGDAEDPLMDASTLQQMQARLDPLFSGGTTSPPPNNVEQQSAAVIGSGSESTPIRALVEDEGERSRVEGERGGERRRRRRETEVGNEVEGDGGVETGGRRRRKKRRSRREGGSEVREQTLGLSDEQERPDTPQQAAGASSSPAQPIPGTSSRVDRAVPHYFPPPEEIQDEGEEGGGGGRVVEGASPVPLTHHASQSPGLVFVERTDGRGFDVRRKTSSVVPTNDDIPCLKAMDRPISSELAALYSHQFVQKISITAYGLVAGLSLWDCVASNVIGSLPGRHLTLLQTYHLLSLPAHSLYLLLLSLVSLSLLDRLDLARVGRQCWQFSLRSLAGLAVVAATVLTGVAFIVSLSLAATDERVSLYPHQPSLWPDIVTPHNLTSTNSTPHSLSLTTHTLSHDITYLPTSDDPTTSSLRTWLGLSAFRSVCCVLGWGLLVLASSHDRMEEYISDMVERSEKAQQESRRPCGAPDSTTTLDQQKHTPQTEPTTAPPLP